MKVDSSKCRRCARQVEDQAKAGSSNKPLWRMERSSHEGQGLLDISVMFFFVGVCTSEDQISSLRQWTLFVVELDNMAVTMVTMTTAIDATTTAATTNGGSYDCGRDDDDEVMKRVTIVCIPSSI